MFETNDLASSSEEDLRVRALLEDYAKVERALGEALLKVEAAQGKLRSREKEMRTLERRLNSARKQSSSDNARIVEELARSYLEHINFLAAPPKVGAEASAESVAILTDAAALGRLLRAMKVKGVEIRTMLERPPTAAKDVAGVRMTVESAKKGDPSSGLLAREVAERGFHSVIIRAKEAESRTVLSLAIDLLPAGAKRVLAVLRSGGDPRNSVRAIVNLDKQTVKVVEREIGFDTPFARLYEREDGWLHLDLTGLLRPDGALAEIELICLPEEEAGTWVSDGDPSRGFLFREPTLEYSVWAAGEALTTPRDPSGPRATPKTPAGQVERRRKLRAAYLASPEYRRVAASRGRHQGERCFIIGNGPSIRDQDLTLLKDEVTFVTNWFVNHDQFEEISPSYMCVSSHEMFGGWGANPPLLNEDWAGSMRAKGAGVRKVFSYAFADYVASSGLFPEDEVDFLLFDKPKEQIDEAGDINLDLSRPMMDGYTGVLTFCLPLAHHFGIKEVYLLGCDCDYAIKPGSDEKSYFYDFSKHTSSTTKTDSLLRVWADDGPVFKSYEIARDRFEADGVSIVNATAGGRLNVFPRLTFEDVMAMPAPGRST